MRCQPKSGDRIPGDRSPGAGDYKRRSFARHPATNLHTGAHRIVRDDRSMKKGDATSPVGRRRSDVQRNDSRSGKLCNCVARHTVTLSGFGAIFRPREALEPVFLRRESAVSVLRSGNYRRVPRSRRLWSGCWQSHRRHRLMTYALIASRTATLMAIMIKKNFPIALPSLGPQRKAAGIVLC